MEPEILLEPDQPAEVSAAVAELVVQPQQPVDPWWQAGLREALADPFQPPVQP